MPAGDTGHARVPRSLRLRSRPERSPRDRSRPERSRPGRAPRDRSRPGRAPRDRSRPSRAPRDRSRPGRAPRDRSRPGRAPRDRSRPGQSQPGRLLPGRSLPRRGRPTRPPAYADPRLLTLWTLLSFLKPLSLPRLLTRRTRNKGARSGHPVPNVSVLCLVRTCPSGPIGRGHGHPGTEHRNTRPGVRTSGRSCVPARGRRLR